MEYHVLIAWGKADIETKTILDSLPEHLKPVKIFSYSWDEKLARENYAAFYGEKLEDIQYKVDHCGSGTFRVFLLCDENPLYEERKTSSGNRVVNCNLFDLKARLRKLTGGGHRIHASDTKSEADLNCMSLFGMRAEELYEDIVSKSPGLADVIDVSRNVTGVSGWDSWNTLLNCIDRITPYVVLRNVETIFEDDHCRHGDTDLLVEDYQSALIIAAARKEAIGKNRVLYSVLVNGTRQLVDFRHAGDGYYCREWEKDMLSTRVEYKDSGVFVMRSENYSYSLLYHALVHKPAVSEDYKEILRGIFKTDDRKEWMRLLDDYMKKHGYAYSKPEDSSVYIHPAYFGNIRLSFPTRIINRLKAYRYRRGLYERDNTKSQAFYKILYTGFYMGISILRKIKTGIGRIIHH